MEEANFSSTVEDIGKLLKFFKLERIVYLFATTVSFVILITSAIFLLFKNNQEYASIFGLFGSSGIISFTASRMLRMWTDAVNMLSNNKTKLGKK